MTAPIACVLAVVCRGGDILLVKRANSPDQGKWGFPGGKVEFGEAVLAATVRELHEETGVEAEALGPLEVIDVFDRPAGQPDGCRLHRHFILIAVRCRWLSGEPVAGDDALDAVWWPLDAIGELDTSVDVERVAQMAMAAR